MVCVDAEGNNLFTEKDVPALAKKNGAALEKIVTAALAFNLMTEEAVLEAGNE